MITLKDIEAASLRIAPYIVRTPVVRLPNMDKYLGCEVYAKAECLQVTGAFKVRGAKLLLLEGHLLAEFSSAIGIGAVLAGKIKTSPKEMVCFVISGGSVDLPQLDRLRSVEF